MFLSRLEHFTLSLESIVEIVTVRSTALLKDVVGASRDLVMGRDSHSFRELRNPHSISTGGLRFIQRVVGRSQQRLDGLWIVLRRIENREANRRGRRQIPL
jgi:hypothetical protein